MITKLLSILFPPHLPGHIRDWEERIERTVEEQGSARLIPTPLTGIEKHWAELKEYPSSYLPARGGKTNQVFTYKPPQESTPLTGIEKHWIGEDFAKRVAETDALRFQNFMNNSGS